MITPAGCIPDNAAIAAHYDDLDELYREIWGTDVHHGYWITGKESAMEAVANLTRLVAEKAAIRSGDRVCDMGCGYGGGARMLNRDYGAEVTGFTISPKQFDHAKAAANGNEELNFILVDALQNNLPAKSFDAVIAIESTEHVALKPRLISEARRLLRCGGHFVIAAWLANERATGWRKKYSSSRSVPRVSCQAWHQLKNIWQCSLNAIFGTLNLPSLQTRLKKPGRFALRVLSGGLSAIQHCAAGSATRNSPIGFLPKPFSVFVWPMRWARCATASSQR